MPRTTDRVTATIDALRARQPQLEEELAARIHGISDPAQVTEQEYVIGLRDSVAVGVSYGIAVMESAAADIQSPPIPARLLAQAHLAARNDVSLDIVLRRYCSANTIITNAIVEESERAGLPRTELKSLLRELAAELDRVMEQIGEEYSREAARLRSRAARPGAELAARLLEGEPLDPAELRFNLDGWNLGFICDSPDPSRVAREIAGGVDRALLLAPTGTELCWAWLGGKRGFEGEELEKLLQSARGAPEDTFVAFGEPARGISGWRLTHHQALSALPVARRSPARVSRYSEVSLVASALHDEILARSLRQLFLEPLGVDRDQGRVAKRTLRAYFQASRNVTSTAAALGVSRRTVTNRLAAIERRVGRPLSGCAAEIETAIRLEELEHH